ncbi:methyltransferase domain-containing protein [Candidatus Saccharibacteria bacterium]|nr:methyltransferase domain-containing protein [Candidatus Saccharibacteria bacterium]
MDENSKTIKSYELNAEEYIQSRSVDDQQKFSTWIAEALSKLNKPIDIFEIGSGPGYTADYLESLGYRVTRSDIVNEFINFNQSSGKYIVRHNVATDAIPRVFDAVLAINVMQHLNSKDMEKSLLYINDGLKKGGLFIFTITLGKNDEWHDDKGGARYFAGWQKEKLIDILNKAGLQVIYDKDVGYKNWINIISKKT